MSIRSENKEVNERFAALLPRRNDLRIGQMVYNALRVVSDTEAFKRLLFYIEDEDLLKLLEVMLENEPYRPIGEKREH